MRISDWSSDVCSSNLFNGDGNGGGFPTARGARDVAGYQMQQAKLVAVIQALQPDVAALMEVEHDGFGADSALAHLVAELNRPTGNGVRQNTRQNSRQ